MSILFWIPERFADVPDLFINYRPQRSCGKVMFSVILFTGGISQHAPGQTPPFQADISQHALGQTPLRQTYPSMHWGRHLPGRHIPACTGADTPPQTATVADGTHSTGMHSCFISELAVGYNRKVQVRLACCVYLIICI